MKNHELFKIKFIKKIYFWLCHIWKPERQIIINTFTIAFKKPLSAKETNYACMSV